MNRFNIPKIIEKMLEEAIKIHVIDAGDLLSMGAEFGEDWDKIVDELMWFADIKNDSLGRWEIMSTYKENWEYHKQKMSISDYKTPPELENDAEDFETRFALFFSGCVEINRSYMSICYPNMKPEVFDYTKGRRYIRVIRGGSAHCFVDTTNGDVLKASSWTAPAKHARGNIFDEKNGLGSMGEYGPAYLR